MDKKQHLTSVAEADFKQFSFDKDILGEIDNLLKHFFELPTTLSNYAAF